MKWIISFRAKWKHKQQPLTCWLYWSWWAITEFLSKKLKIVIIFSYFLLELTNWASQNQRKIQPCGTVIIFFTFQSHSKKFSDIFVIPAEINAVTVTTFSICATNFKYFFYGKFRIEWTFFPFEPFCTWSSTNCGIGVVFCCTTYKRLKRFEVIFVP